MRLATLAALALSLVVAVTQTQALSTDGRVRLLVLDWFSNTTGAWTPFAGIGMGTGAELRAATAMHFVLAANAFNQRNARLYPALASIAPNCVKNVSIVSVCDEAGSARRAAMAVREFAAQVDVVVGFSSRAGAISGAAAADSLAAIATVSHGATAQDLSNNLEFPLVARTAFADDLYVAPLAAFIASLNVTHVATLYLDSDNGPKFKEALEVALLTRGVDTASFPFARGDVDSVRSSLAQIQATRRAVVICLAYAPDVLTNIANVASALGMTSGNNLWVFSSFGALPFSVSASSLDDSANATALLKGALVVSADAAGVDADSFNAHVAALPSQVSLLPTINALLPPHGARNESGLGCRNDATSVSVSSGVFTNGPPDAAQAASWARAFDTVLAVGLAACAADAGPNAPDGETLRRFLSSVSFQGLSGAVQFDNVTGSRVASTFPLVVLNYRPANGSTATSNDLTLTTVGSYDATADVWTFSQPVFLASTNSLVAPASLATSLPSEFLQPDQDFKFLPHGLKILGYVEVATLQTFCAVCAAWLIYYRKNRVVTSSQGPVLLIMVFGLSVASWAILALTVDGSPGEMIAPQAACAFGPFLFAWGFLVALAALSGKTIRVYSVFNRTALMRTGISLERVYLGVALVACFALALLVAWTAASPMMWIRFVDFVDANGQPTVSHGSCVATTSTSVGFAAFFVTAYFAALVVTLMVAQRAKNLPEEFQEAGWATLAMTVLIQVFIVAVPGTIAVYDRQVVGRFVILSTLVFLSIFFLLLFIFHPKMTYLRHGGYVALFGPSNTRLDKSGGGVVSAGGGVGVSGTGARQGSVTDGFAGGEKRGGGGDLADFAEMDAALRSPVVRRRFERFAERNFLLESYHFIVDCQTFKDMYDSRPEAWRKETAKSLVSVFIAESSILQVNISSDLRDDTIRRATAAGAPPKDCFDAALLEVLKMLMFGGWKAFVDEGGLYGVPGMEGLIAASGGRGGGGAKNTSKLNNASVGELAVSTSPTS